MRVTILNAALLGLLASMAVSISSQAAEESSEAPVTPAEPMPEKVECVPPTYKHVLRNHAFLPSFGVPTPFADTSTLLGVGVGLANFISPTTGGESKIDVGAFSPSIEGQVAVAQRLALSLNIGATVTVGINGESALRYGASTSYKLGVGALYELVRIDSTVFSAGLSFSKPHSISISPLEAVKGAVKDALGGEGAAAIENSTTTEWYPSLRAAHAFNAVIGLRGLGGFKISAKRIEAVSTTTTSTRMLLGLGADADFKPVIGIPIALNLNYTRGQTISSGTANSDTLTLGLYESVSPIFNVGVETGTIKKGNATATIVALAVRTYYN